MAKMRNPKGLGHYYKKNGLFCWRYSLNGNTIDLSSKTEQGLKDKIKNVIGLPITKSKLTVSEWFETWLETYVLPLKKKATYDQYYHMYHSYVKPIIGIKRLNSVTSIDIQTVITKMNTMTIETKNKKGVVLSSRIGTATKTMKHVKTTMSVAFKQALENKLVSENPVKNIKIPNKQAKPRKTLTTDELSLLLDSLKNSRWIWSVKFALVTGVRRGELLALKWTDIEWDNKRIRIDESNSRTGLGDTKSSKVHYAPLSGLAQKYLLYQSEMLKSEKNPMALNDDNTAKELKGSDLLIFPTERGTMIKPNSYYRVIQRAAEKSGIKAHPHCFRHTFVYKMRKTLSLSELQEALGHDESTTTLDIYGDMINDKIDKTADSIDEVFNQVESELGKVKKVIEQKEEAKVISLFDRKKAK